VERMSPVASSVREKEEWTGGKKGGFIAKHLIKCESFDETPLEGGKKVACLGEKGR